MKRFEKLGDNTIKLVTLPIRVVLGAIYAIADKTPDTLEVPYELKKKGENNEDIFRNNSDSDSPKFENVIGRSNKADAKIAGITPAVFIFNGK